MTDIIILGILVSIIFYEITDITPGGIIVPGLMVMCFNSPIRMLYTLAIAIASYYIVKLLSRRFIIFGKRRFVLLIIISLGLHFVINLIFSLFLQDFTITAFSVVGYTVSGIIANNIHKQGVVRTSVSLFIVVGITELLVLLLSTIGVIA